MSNENNGIGKTGKFAKLAQEAERRKEYSFREDAGLTGYGTIPHDLWRVYIPIAQEYGGRRMGDMALLYSYLMSNVNGQRSNDRYMSAWASVDSIVENTGIGVNRVSALADALEAVGLLVTAYDYTGNKRNKLYYPQYYSDLTDEEVHANMGEWMAKHGKRLGLIK